METSAFQSVEQSNIDQIVLLLSSGVDSNALSELGENFLCLAVNTEGQPLHCGSNAASSRSRSFAL